MIRRIFLFLIVSLTVNASVEIRQTGCFLISGQVVQVSNLDIILQIDSQTRSEELLQIHLDQNPASGPLITNGLITVRANAIHPGAAAKINFEGIGPSVRYLSTRQLAAGQSMRFISKKLCR